MTSRHLQKTIHVRLEVFQILFQMLQTEIVDDNDVTVHGGDDHSVAEAGYAHAHETVGPEDVAVILAGLGIFVDVPKKDGTVQTRRDEAIFSSAELDIFDPICVTSERPHSASKETSVPKSNCCVI